MRMYSLLLVGGLFLVGCSGPGGLLAVGGGADSPDDLDGNEAGGGFPPPPPVEGAGQIRARIRNYSDEEANVTLRYSLFDPSSDEDIVIRVTYLRVPADFSTTLRGPEVADRLSITGQTLSGETLSEATFSFGVDFVDQTEAVYQIGVDRAVTQTPPSLIFETPLSNVQIRPGDELNWSIADVDPDSNATIMFYLAAVAQEGDAESPDGETGDEESSTSVFSPELSVLAGDEMVLAGPVSEDEDGQNDQFTILLDEDMPFGDYRLFAVITDESSMLAVQAPGLVTVAEVLISPEGNFLPDIDMVGPSNDVEILTGETFIAEWTDADEDSSALVSILLDPDDQTLDGDEYLVAFDIDEDLEDEGDMVEITVSDVPPGDYRVIGVISDGGANFTSVARGVVTILAADDNDPPTLELLQPSVDVEVSLTETLAVSWNDRDQNDNGQITILLDPDLINGNGNEIELGTFPEDSPINSRQIALPSDLAPGTYGLVGRIADEVFNTITRAEGSVTITP